MEDYITCRTTPLAVKGLSGTDPTVRTPWHLNHEHWCKECKGLNRYASLYPGCYCPAYTPPDTLERYHVAADDLHEPDATFSF